MKSLAQCAVLLVACGVASGAGAQQIYKCANGAYQQTPCPNGAAPAKVYRYSPEPDSTPLKVASENSGEHAAHDNNAPEPAPPPATEQPRQKRSGRGSNHGDANAAPPPRSDG